jgi:hypothetical protein
MRMVRGPQYGRSGEGRLHDDHVAKCRGPGSDGSKVSTVGI